MTITRKKIKQAVEKHFNKAFGINVRFTTIASAFVVRQLNNTLNAELGTLIPRNIVFNTTQDIIDMLVVPTRTMTVASSSSSSSNPLAPFMGAWEYRYESLTIVEAPNNKGVFVSFVSPHGHAIGELGFVKSGQSKTVAKGKLVNQAGEVSEYEIVQETKKQLRIKVAKSSKNDFGTITFASTGVELIYGSVKKGESVELKKKFMTQSL